MSDECGEHESESSKPRVVELREKFVEERAPPSEEEYDFIETSEGD